MDLRTIEEIKDELASLRELPYRLNYKTTSRIVLVEADLRESSSRFKQAIDAIEKALERLEKRVWEIEMQDETSETYQEILRCITNMLHQILKRNPTFTFPDPFAADPVEDVESYYHVVASRSAISVDQLIKRFPIVVEKARKEGSRLAKEELEKAKKRLREKIASCPDCQRSFDEMEISYFSSPQWTWEHLCGRAGWKVYCPHCKKEAYFELVIMN